MPMTHVYYHPITVTLAHDGRPATLYWRGRTYRVLELNEPWRLMDRWWQPADPAAKPNVSVAGARHTKHTGHQGRSDRTYYRLRCVSTASATREDLTCDIYFEAVGGVWILERVYD